MVWYKLFYMKHPYLLHIWGLVRCSSKLGWPLLQEMSSQKHTPGFSTAVYCTACQWWMFLVSARWGNLFISWMYYIQWNSACWQLFLVIILFLKICGFQDPLSECYQLIFTGSIWTAECIKNCHIYEDLTANLQNETAIIHILTLHRCQWHFVHVFKELNIFSICCNILQCGEEGGLFSAYCNILVFLCVWLLNVLVEENLKF